MAFAVELHFMQGNGFRCRHCVSCSELAFAVETEFSAANMRFAAETEYSAANWHSLPSCVSAVKL